MTIKNDFTNTVTDEFGSREHQRLAVDGGVIVTGSNNEVMQAGEIFEKNRRMYRVEAAIRKALKERAFMVYYQPIWDRDGNRVRSAEALIRLKDDELGFVSPEEFIPIAEKNGMIVEIGNFVFEEVCRFYKGMNLQDFGIDNIEINLSGVQCMSTELVDCFDRILSQYRLEAEHINLEIAERVVTENRHKLKRILQMLSDRGFRFSIDDYRTRCSNLSFMHGLPISIVKIDKSILWNAMPAKLGAEDLRAREMLIHTIKKLQDMNYEILVEGVETEEQKAMLENLKCDHFQGYLFSQPVSETMFLNYLMGGG